VPGQLHRFATTAARLFVTAETRISSVLRWMSCSFLTLIFAVLIYQITARFILHVSSPWSEVTARGLMIWCVWTAAPTVFARGGLVAVEFFAEMVRGPYQTALKVFIAGVTIAFLLAIFSLGLQMTMRVSVQRIAGLNVSIAWIYAAIPVGALISAFAAVSLLLNQTLLHQPLPDDAVVGSGE
jgi:TRAP-type C4-dicarboxylate transport system permease small subunit